MKLRDKKTGAIYSIEDIDLENDQDGIWLGLTKYTSLAELNEDWEDYEENKKRWYWYICYDGSIRRAEQNNDDAMTERIEIGNYFKTKAEAKGAIEKLKALKRLKDKGFEFELWDYDGGNYQERINTGRILFRVSDDKDVDEDLSILLFGGEE